MIDRDFADRFAAEWVAAWNAHDLDRVLAHYTDDFEMSSPAIADYAGKPSGLLRGKDAVRRYWAAALAELPDLRFDLETVAVGASSVALAYRGPRGLGVEVFFFDDARRVARAAAHYA